LKKIVQSVYGIGYELGDTKFRIPLRANIFCLLQIHTDPWFVCTSLLPRGLSSRDVGLATHLYQVSRWCCSVQRFR